MQSVSQFVVSVLCHMMMQFQLCGMEKRETGKGALLVICSTLAVEVRGPTVGEAEDTSPVLSAL